MYRSQQPLEYLLSLSTEPTVPLGSVLFAAFEAPECMEDTLIRWIHRAVSGMQPVELYLDAQKPFSLAHCLPAIEKMRGVFQAANQFLVMNQYPPIRFFSKPDWWPEGSAQAVPAGLQGPAPTSLMVNGFMLWKRYRAATPFKQVNQFRLKQAFV